MRKYALEERIKETIGIPDIDRFLDYYATEIASSEAADPRQTGLSRIARDLENEEKRAAYRIFFQHGRDSDLENVSEVDRNSLMNHLFSALSTIVDTRKDILREFLDGLTQKTKSLPRSQVPRVNAILEFADYWNAVTGLFFEGVTLRKNISRSKLARNLMSFSYKELDTVYNDFIYVDGNLARENLELVLKEVSKKVDFDKKKILRAARYGAELGGLYERWMETRPEILEHDPKLTRITRFQKDIELPAGTLEEVFDFTGLEGITKDERVEIKVVKLDSSFTSSPHYNNTSTNPSY